MGEMTFEEAERYVLELPLHTKKNPFEAVKDFYGWLGEPGSGFPVIHVAGTNGKGSVCAYVNSILSVAGYRIGMFTSPHLVDLRERFVLGNERIGKEDFARLLGVLRKRLRECRGRAYRPTFFETLFFIFMLWMEQERPDGIVLETGMGGRLDATNVIDRSAVVAITRIGLDHCAFLGDTREQIAEEKVCIFKEKIPAVCLETDRSVTQVFVKKAQKLSVPLVMVSKKEVSLSKIKKNYIDFFLKSAYDRDIEARLHTIGVYQMENAALAVRIIEQAETFFHVEKAQIEEGLSRMRWAARMEEVLPEVYLDGAHNPDGVRAFLQSVQADGVTGERFLLFGACADKEAGQMADMLQESGLFSCIRGTLIDSGRSLTAEQMRELFAGKEPGMDFVYPDSAAALKEMAGLRKGQDRIYIAGSLYLAGEIERHLQKEGGLGDQAVARPYRTEGDHD